ncbi:hypothetical protein NBO_451g0009 [Nosema bombycis CQ1]|uniref:Uncharacterized protein n=1 Tax=Nosema bombycis (strain CQ1 / CVCC 102059) TaxID=578461 RepID=R0MI10_NOSB1|nr:hypothetical protein NBO_451g0009 [Nosema bombycis CQ1]|eukprot:EOB12398.1 hypothetical protein NBO_451g0009 [Nosema bombycis CQ1]
MNIGIFYVLQVVLGSMMMNEEEHASIFMPSLTIFKKEVVHKPNINTHSELIHKSETTTRETIPSVIYAPVRVQEKVQEKEEIFTMEMAQKIIASPALLYEFVMEGVDLLEELKRILGIDD